MLGFGSELSHLHNGTSANASRSYPSLLCESTQSTLTIEQTSLSDVCANEAYCMRSFCCVWKRG